MELRTEMELLFKDKIDWKFFNYLKDKLVKYEDDGIGVILNICVKITYYKNDYIIIYNYHNFFDGDEQANNEYFLNNASPKLCLEYYKDSGIYYMVSLTKDISQTQYYSEIKNKCKIISSYNGRIIFKAI